jgi:hypothetical protein
MLSEIDVHKCASTALRDYYLRVAGEPCLKETANRKLLFLPVLG